MKEYGPDDVMARLKNGGYRMDLEGAFFDDIFEVYQIRNNGGNYHHIGRYDTLEEAIAVAHAIYTDTGFETRVDREINISKGIWVGVEDPETIQKHLRQNPKEFNAPAPKHE